MHRVPCICRSSPVVLARPLSAARALHVLSVQLSPLPASGAGLCLEPMSTSASVLGFQGNSIWRLRGLLLRPRPPSATRAASSVSGEALCCCRGALTTRVKISPSYGQVCSRGRCSHSWNLHSFVV